jgi:hypothetical protein
MDEQTPHICHLSSWYKKLKESAPLGADLKGAIHTRTRSGLEGWNNTAWVSFMKMPINETAPSGPMGADGLHCHSPSTLYPS